MKLPRLLAAMAWLAFIKFAVPVPALADTGDTLNYIHTRGMLRCGVSTGITGFSVRDAAGAWSGMDVDFCRAVAADVLGDPRKVAFIPLNATARFPAIESRDIDILARNTTWTVQREAIYGVAFVGVLYYDEAAFLVRASGPYASSATVDGARICVEAGSNHLADVTAFASQHGWRFTPVVSPSFQAGRQAFLAGQCDIYTDDISALHDMLLHVPDPAAYVIRPERVAKEPLSPLVRWDDGQWVAIVRAVYAALVDADERGLTQAQATAGGQAAYLAETAPVGHALGLAPDWALKVIASVGNYGEIFNRNLGDGSPLNLAPGLNRPAAQGGLLYAPPFQ